MFLKLLGYVIALSLLACVYLVLKKHASLKSSTQHEGKVIDYVRRPGSRGGSVFALKVEYRDGQGVVRHFVAGGASNPPARAINDPVTVFEHPDGSDPDLLVFENLYLLYWIWFCLGVAAAGCLAAPAILRLLYHP